MTAGANWWHLEAEGYLMEYVTTMICYGREWESGRVNEVRLGPLQGSLRVNLKFKVVLRVYRLGTPEYVTPYLAYVLWYSTRFRLAHLPYWEIISNRTSGNTGENILVKGNNTYLCTLCTL